MYKLNGSRDESHLSLIDLKVLPDDLTMLPAFFAAFQFLEGPRFLSSFSLCLCLSFYLGPSLVLHLLLYSRLCFKSFDLWLILIF